MFLTHIYLIAGPIIAVAALFAAQRFLGRTFGWCVAALIVPMFLILIALGIYGTTGLGIYASSVIPIYFVGLAFGWRARNCSTCTEKPPCSND